MPAGSLWSGTVSFGMVAIPVGIVTAARPKHIAFNLLHDQDHARLERKMYCPKDNTFVHPEHIVKGYKIAPDEYVVVTQDEINSLEPKQSQTIEITEFVDLDSIDPIYYDRPYYLEPHKGGQKPYLLLVRALEKTRKAGIATFVMQDRKYITALRSIEGLLTLITLHYPEDIRDSGDIGVGDVEVEAEQVDQLAQKIEKMSVKFEPEKYKNNYYDKFKQLLEEKTRRHEIVQAPGVEQAEPEQPPDLMAALEESLQKAKHRREQEGQEDEGQE